MISNLYLGTLKNYICGAEEWGKNKVIPLLYPIVTKEGLPNIPQVFQRLCPEILAELILIVIVNLSTDS